MILGRGRPAGQDRAAESEAPSRRPAVPPVRPARPGDGTVTPAGSPAAPRFLRLVRFLAATCVLCAVAAFPGSSLFNLDTVVVRGNAHIAGAEILRRVGIGPGDNAFRVDAVAIRERLREDPRIADASIALAFPRNLMVSVRERDPVAALAFGEGYVLLGADGVAIARVSGPGAAMPLVVDRLDLPWVQAGTAVPSPSVRFGVTVAATLPPRLRPDVIGLRVDASGEVVLQARDGMWVKVGTADGLTDRLAMVPGVLAAVRARGLHAQYVDLRVPGSIVVMPAGAAPQDGATPARPGAPATVSTPPTPSMPDATPRGGGGQENTSHRGIQPGPPHPVPP
ncbi:MAG TPA: FtsQ-type POTRA domain-containing protein [bacterium]|nr:FtsQ-type POTRA domain-containing protein [bacterium]